MEYHLLNTDSKDLNPLNQILIHFAHILFLKKKTAKVMRASNKINNTAPKAVQSFQTLRASASKRLSIRVEVRAWCRGAWMTRKLKAMPLGLHFPFSKSNATWTWVGVQDGEVGRCFSMTWMYPKTDFFSI